MFQSFLQVEWKIQILLLKHWENLVILLNMDVNYWLILIIQKNLEWIGLRKFVHV